MTSESFLSALRRFVCRRGTPSHIHSDNARTFIGARCELAELGKFLQQNSNELARLAQNQNITWHLIPACFPHFGGLWEAGVKSVKYHLKRVTFHASLTYETLYTLLVQIEVVLNSRPLTPLSSGCFPPYSSYSCQFPNWETITSLPDEDVLELPVTKLSHYQRIQQLHQHFWTRWHKKCISELQKRLKWTASSAVNVKEGTLVLMKEDNLPPIKWKMGVVVVSIHLGSRLYMQCQ